jgi:membrane-associated PAP2 superfamily phosphatase
VAIQAAKTGGLYDLDRHCERIHKLTKVKIYLRKERLRSFAIQFATLTIEYNPFVLTNLTYITATDCTWIATRS